MKFTSKYFNSILAATLLFAHASWAAEEWKVRGYDQQFQVSVMTGMTVMGTTPGFGFSGSIAKQILNKGFFPDMTNQVYLEASFGPTFMRNGVGTGTGFQMSGHMRWDFHKNELWTLYGLGGIGWDIYPGITNSHGVHFRFGAGAFWHLFPNVSFRAELSHEFMGVGAAFMF